MHNGLQSDAVPSIFLLMQSALDQQTQLWQCQQQYERSSEASSGVTSLMETDTSVTLDV